MTAVPADLRRERRNPNNSVDALQLALDALRDFERVVPDGTPPDTMDTFWPYNLASLRFALASTVEQRRCSVALERIALAVETIARQEMNQ